MDDLAFKSPFEYLTGHQPYEWQVELFRSLVCGRMPNLSLPTGSGKTNVIVCWLLALCRNPTLPRRLIYVVDRRSVVDQSTKVVEGIAAKLTVKSPAISDIRDALVKMADDKEPLGISTLRGEFQDNREWSRLPFRPAVVCGTVDMVGSRLLFSGYGDGPYSRSLHAGLLGNDSLVIFDECHLVPEFGALLRLIHNAGGKLKPFCYMLMSATSNDKDSIQLSKSDMQDATLGKRLYAPKTLKLWPTQKPITEELKTLAETNPPPRTIVFVRRPEDVAKIAASLRKMYRNVVTLTGTMRGKERDELVNNAVFQAFTVEQQPAERHFLIATSAGEVGIDLTCDRMVTDTSSTASLVQRFGRCNRFGETQGEIYLVYNPSRTSKMEGEHSKAIDFLKKLDGDVSCINLWNHREELTAMAADEVAVQSLPPHVLNVLSMTSLRHGIDVSAYLRGREDENQYVEIAWRKEVNLLATMSSSDFESYMNKMRVLSFEKLNETTERVLDLVDEILARQGDAVVVVIRANADRQITTLSGLRQVKLRNCLILLPPDRGGLSSGMFSVENIDQAELDIAEMAHQHHQPRVRHIIPLGDMVESIPGWENIFETEVDDSFIAVAKPKKEKRKYKDVLLRDHNLAVAATARKFAELAALDTPITEAMEYAGRHHDEGKASPIWQFAAKGGSVEKPLAKTSHLDTRKLAGYRHEFGNGNGLADRGELAQHLVASHHAGGRPTWLGDRSLSPINKSPDDVLEQVLRFANLQARYGWWGLAYLEAILRSADAYVSGDDE